MKLVKALGIGPVHFIDRVVGQIFALSYPNMLQSLILCSTTSRVTEPNPPEDTWDRRIEDIKSSGIEGIVEPAL